MDSSFFIHAAYKWIYMKITIDRSPLRCYDNPHAFHKHAANLWAYLHKAILFKTTEQQSSGVIKSIDIN